MMAIAKLQGYLSHPSAGAVLQVCFLSNICITLRRLEKSTVLRQMEQQDGKTREPSWISHLAIYPTVSCYGN